MVSYRKVWAKCLSCGYKIKLSELEEKEKEGAIA